MHRRSHWHWHWHWLGVATLLAAGCVKRVETPSVKPRSVRLLAAAAPRETQELEARREDLEVDTDFERVPRVVATGETGVLDADGATFTLAGDEAGSQGFSVDNFILLEALAPDGAVLGRAVIGFVDGVSLGRERLDSLGRQVFAFEANEVSLKSVIPERGPFRLRATALDIGGVGAVSDVYVVVSAKKDTEADDLRQ